VAARRQPERNAQTKNGRGSRGEARGDEGRRGAKQWEINPRRTMPCPRGHCTRPVRCVHERTTRIGTRDPTARRARATSSRRQPAVGRDTETWSDERPDADARRRAGHTYDSARDLDLADAGGALLCKGRPGAPPRRRTAVYKLYRDMRIVARASLHASRSASHIHYTRVLVGPRQVATDKGRLGGVDHRSISMRV
jgi:hypothetical protein